TDVGAFIGERLEEGADFIKLIVEDMSAYPGAPALPTLTPGQVTAVIDAAHAADRLALVHASTLEDSRYAVDAGADGLVHIFADRPVDQGFIDVALANDAFVVPTLSVLASFSGMGEGATLASDPHPGPALTAEQRATLAARIPGVPRNDRLEQAIASLRALHEAGGTIHPGSDAPTPGTAPGARRPRTGRACMASWSCWCAPGWSRHRP